MSTTRITSYVNAPRPAAAATRGGTAMEAGASAIAGALLPPHSSRRRACEAMRAR
jgi:hypothetical protein